MEQFLLVFYILFFATGFMGGAALFLLELRMQSRLLRPLLVFQLLFLLGMGLIVVYYYGESKPGGIEPNVAVTLMSILSAINGAVYGIIIVLIRRISPPSIRRTVYPLIAEILAGIVVAKSIANIVVFTGAHTRNSLAVTIGGAPFWNLGGHLFSAAAMIAFGLFIRGKFSSNETNAVRRLLKAYGLCVIIFAPIGLIEYGVQVAELPWLRSISLDHFFYFAWNLISMSAAVRLFKPPKEGVPYLDAVPEEHIKAFGLSARETEMAILIARGLANKEIAAELSISPATVRTHIYNLYQKTNARSRIELLNKLKS